MARGTPAQDKAVAFLVSLLQSTNSARTTRLPTHAVLAKQCGVSPVTMLRALKTLREEGLIDVSHGSGVTVRGADSGGVRGEPEDSSFPLARTWGRVSQHLYADIVNGTFAPGAQLPSIKELCSQYGAGSRVVRKSLVLLSERGHITPYRRGYRVPDLIAPRKGHSIALVGVGSEEGGVQILTSRTQEMIRGLEAGCARAQCSLNIVPFFRDQSERRFLSDPQLGMSDGPAAHSVLGYVVFAGSIEETVTRRLLPHLTRTGLPVAVLDETGAGNMFDQSGDRRRVRVFAMGGGTQPGEKAGEFLLGQGHRSIAYLSPFFGCTYARNRFRGLSRAFRDAGIHGGVAKHVIDQDTGSHSLDDADAASDEHLKAMSHVAGHVRSLKHQIDWVLQQELFSEDTRRLCRAAIADEGITAWVCDNDHVALEALEFLREAGVEVPGRIALLGFDDTLESSMHGLSSYNFNASAYVNAMLAHVLHFSMQRSGTIQKQAIEIEGYVTRRKTA